MNRENYLQFVASFLVVLVLTIPFYVADVYAAIDEVSVKGSDGIEGFARSADFLNFKVKASIEDDKITPDQIVLGSDNPFQKCAAGIGNGYDCALRFPSSGNDDFEARSLPYAINLYKDDGTLDDSITNEFVIDNKAPEVELKATQSKFSSRQNVTLNYEVRDFACDDPSCSGKCTGIKSIEFFTLDNSFSQKVDVSKNDCSYSSSISVESARFDNGLNSIFAKATDKFNQVSPEASASFDIDIASPVISADSFEITRKGFSISAFSSQKVPVKVSVNISAADLDANSVTADLSGLNQAGNLKNAKASCSAAGSETYTCTWNIDLGPGKAGVKSIVVDASDLVGNKASTTISKDLSLDNTGPKVLFLATTQVAADRVFAKPSGNTVIAEFEESSGMSPSDVFLHNGDKKVSASSCALETNWICKWNNVNFDKNNPKMSIESDTVDILNNKVPEDKIVELIIDTKTPELKSLNITNIGGATEAFPGLFKIGDKIAVVANLTEDNDLFASADFSKFVTGATNVEGNCERIQDDEQTCVWISDQMNLAGNGIVTFNFSDNAGNTLVVTKSLKVFGLVNATVPDFWINNVTCSPKTIDRQLGPLINQREFCQVKLIPKSQVKKLSTIFIGPATCSGDTSIVEDVETSNTDAGSTSPLIKIILKKDDFRINTANLTCSLDIFSKVDGKVTQNPEIENVHIKVFFSNLPLGELDQNVRDEIKRAKDDAKGIWDIIGVLNKIFFYAKKICQLIDTIYNAVAVLYTIVIVLTSAEAVVEKTPAFLVSFFGLKETTIAMCGTETATRVTAQVNYEVLNKFCALVNCKNTILWGPTVANWINNQPLLSPSALLGTETEVKGEFPFNQEVKLKNDQPAGPLSSYIRPATEYMDPNKNIVIAALFACIPGIIYGLEKYRQILCLYADCVQNGVGKEGLPLKACQDQKAFATCKYVTTELFFGWFPWTVVFDHYMNLIKNSMSNPFTALGVGISVACNFVCSIPEGTARAIAFHGCEFARLFNQIGAIAQDVKSIVDEGFKIRTDYCERLDDNEK